MISVGACSPTPPVGRIIKMAKRQDAVKAPGVKKKTKQGNGTFTKSPNSGGGTTGSTTSKTYRKKKGNRGQGK